MSQEKPASQPAKSRPYPKGRALVLGLLALGALVVMFTTNLTFGAGLLALVIIAVTQLLPLNLNPITERKVKRFREIKRGYYSFLILGALTVLSLFSELFVNNRPLVVSYDGVLHFPIYGSVERGDTYGLEGIDARIPVNYRELEQHWETEGSENWMLMPLIPYAPNEQTEFQGVLKPRPPSFASQHYLGTDSVGRDILARLIYGSRIAIFFALAFMVLTYLIGIAIGCAMGYFGGLFDLTVQRLIEIWSNIPFLYMVIIVFSVIPATFSVSIRIGILLTIMVIFSWTSMTYYMRTATYKEKARDYVSAARVLGAGTGRIIFTHVIPNTISTIVTFMPFTIVSAITAITALDFLGFGLPPPTPSLGELLKQGRDNLTTAPWIVSSAFTSLVILLTLVTFVGEAIREAFDPRKFTIYD